MSEQKYDFVNAHINNISFPKTIEQLEDFIDSASDRLEITFGIDD